MFLGMFLPETYGHTAERFRLDEFSTFQLFCHGPERCAFCDTVSSSGRNILLHNYKCFILYLGSIWLSNSSDFFFSSIKAAVRSSTRSSRSLEYFSIRLIKLSMRLPEKPLIKDRVRLLTSSNDGRSSGNSDQHSCITDSTCGLHWPLSTAGRYGGFKPFLTSRITATKQRKPLLTEPPWISNYSN